MASTTKLMTAYLAREALDLDRVVTTAPYEPGPFESLMRLRRGEQVSVHDLLYGLLLASGNDAAVTLAVAVAGSEEAFVSRMNDAAAELGLSDTSYENPIGFDAPTHFTTARDLVALALELRDDRVLSEIVDTDRATLVEGERVRRIRNRNTLVRRVPFVDGVKTGYTDSAGYVLVASGERNGITLVSALLGAPSERARDTGSLGLLRWGFSRYARERALVANEVLARVPVVDRDVEVSLAASRPVDLVVRPDERVDVRTERVPAEVGGPIPAGKRLGTAIVTVDGSTQARVPLLATEAVAAASTIERIDAALPGRRAAALGLLALGAGAVIALIAVAARWVAGRGRPAR